LKKNCESCTVLGSNSGRVGQGLKPLRHSPVREKLLKIQYYLFRASEQANGPAHPESPAGDDRLARTAWWRDPYSPLNAGASDRSAQSGIGLGRPISDGIRFPLFFSSLFSFSTGFHIVLLVFFL
jgi:hypothetical protein